MLESGLVPPGYFREYLRENVRWLTGGSLEPCDAGRYSIAIDASANVAACLAKHHAGNFLEHLVEPVVHKSFSSSSGSSASPSAGPSSAASSTTG